MRHSELLATIQNLTNEKPKQRELAEALSCNIGVIGKRASRDSVYSLEELNKINDYYGQKFYEFDLFAGKYNTNLVHNVIRKTTSTNEDEIAVDYYPEVFGSCGGGVFVPAEYKERMNIPKKFFSSYNPLKKYSVINAFGDSMMPYIHDRDKLLVEHYENGEQIRDNRIYIFRYGEKIFCKRLVDNLNFIVVKSDNPMYEPIKIDLKEVMDDFQIIGRIVGMVRDID